MPNDPCVDHDLVACGKLLLEDIDAGQYCWQATSDQSATCRLAPLFSGVFTEHPRYSKLPNVPQTPCTRQNTGQPLRQTYPKLKRNAPVAKKLEQNRY